MQYGKRLLGLGFGRDKVHRRARRGFTNCLGIGEIVFVTFDEGPNELR